ncbi:MAG: hypothetical protein IJ125_01090 [Atopobiaceae bacterium]|nr:hypothetical protein [Atopobiaceae bacterium]
MRPSVRNRNYVLLRLLCAFVFVLSALIAGLGRPALAETSAEVRQQIEAEQKQLNELVAQSQATQQEIDELTNQLNDLADKSIDLQGTIIADRDELARAVSANYKSSSAGSLLLELLFSTKSLDEIQSSLYYAQRTVEWQSRSVERLKADKQTLDEQLGQIATAREERTGLLQQNIEQQNQMATLITSMQERAAQLEEQERQAELERLAEQARLAEEARRAAEAAMQQATVTPVPTTDAAGGWIECIASAYSIADNDPPGSTATASGVPLDDNVPTVALPMSQDPARFYGRRIEISYGGMSVIATITDCGYMDAGRRGLDVSTAVYRAFGFVTGDDWGLRTVRYRFI